MTKRDFNCEYNLEMAISEAKQIIWDFGTFADFMKSVSISETDHQYGAAKALYFLCEQSLTHLLRGKRAKLSCETNSFFAVIYTKEQGRSYRVPTTWIYVSNAAKQALEKTEEYKKIQWERIEHATDNLVWRVEKASEVAFEIGITLERKGFGVKAEYPDNEIL